MFCPSLPAPASRRLMPALLCGVAGLVAALGSSQTALAVQGSAGAEGSGEKGWLVRGLPEYTSQTRIELAKAGKPTWLEVQAQRITVSALVNAACGKQDDKTRNFLVAEAVRINGLDGPQDPLRKGEVAAIPFCLRVDSKVDVAVLPGENPSSILTERAGIAGKVTLQNTYQLNRDRYGSYQDFVRRLQPGTITVPYVAPEKMFVPKQNGVGPLAIVRKNEPPGVQQQALAITSAVGEDGSPPPPPPSLPADIASPASGELHLVSALKLSPQDEARMCGAPPAGYFKPFDAAALKNAYEVSAETRRTRYPLASDEAHVGIVDTGLSGLDSGFFAQKYFLPNELEREPPGRRGEDDDQTGVLADYKDDVYGANLDSGGDITPYPDPTYRQISHGTQMTALVLGGQDVVTGWFSSLAKPPIRVKVFKFTRRPQSPETTKMAEADLLPKAIEYLAEVGVTAVNMSLATESRARLIKATLEKQSNILFVVAAGNGRPGGASNGVDLSYANTILPAGLGGHRQLANVLTVAAYGYDGTRAKFSNYSPDNVDILAPGCGLQAPNIEGTFDKVSGSSAAAAVTTFGAALVRSLGPQGMTAVDVRNRLIVGTDYDPALTAYAAMPGRLNLVKAVSLYKDILEPAGAAPGLVYGKIADRRHLLTACQNFTADLQFIADKEILKIVPNLRRPNGQTEMHFWLQRNGVERRICAQEPNSAAWQLGSIDGNGTATKMPALGTIKEIIFSSY